MSESKQPSIRKNKPLILDDRRTSMNTTAAISHINNQVNLIRQASLGPFAKTIDELEPHCRDRVLDIVEQYKALESSMIQVS